MDRADKPGISFFERYLTNWVAVCIAAVVHFRSHLISGNPCCAGLQLAAGDQVKLFNSSWCWFL